MRENDYSSKHKYLNQKRDRKQFYHSILKIRELSQNWNGSLQSFGTEEDEDVEHEYDGEIKI